MNEKGFFITLEGIEGVGKTTNMDFVHKQLVAAGKDVILTREPGGTSLGEDVRNLLLGHKHDGMSSETELLLMFAARAEHLSKVIMPAVMDGKVVLCDRFTDATYAYQGGGRGIPTRRIQELEQWVQGGTRPDMTFLLDLPVEVGLERAGKRSAADRFEKEDMAFFQRVRDRYLQLAAEYPQRFRVIDASKPLDDVQQQISNALQEILN
ncbi:MAG: dTMP kinase [Gammaproteobacteria bacterium]|nr:dTMP kinase [Gammaproteobacteria bacterium]MDH5594300.1 dTMP kinase [Gammaproteobacteria bacterium]MDH5613811.1 dTMP kinase [Gammaproteobacteria bacterium]